MKKIITTIVIATILASCSKDFLHKEPSETASDPLPEYKLNGLYTLMVKATPNGGYGPGGTSLHTDFGQKAMDAFTDILSSDMALAANQYGQYEDCANYITTVNSSDIGNYMPWRYYYRIINASNEVIESLGGNDTTPSRNSDKHAMGQAKALRAHSYFNLLQMYTTEYQPDALSIPLYVKSGQPSQPQVKQSEVYAQVVKDLEEAVNLLNGFDRGTNKAFVNKYIAEGILAYVYAAMGNYQKVADLSKDIIDNGGFTISSKTDIVRAKHNGSADFTGGGFNSVTTPSWMWGFDITLDNKLDLVSWWGAMDVFTYSYTWAGDAKTMDENLYNAIRTDDIRKLQFEGTYRGMKYLPTNKFFAPDRKVGGQRNITTDYIYMRVDEFHLLRAEALAKIGQESEAKNTLKEFLKTRITNVSYIDALADDALKNEIYLNTRIEFWGEGKTYFALKRNKASVTRGNNHLYRKGETFNHNSDELTLEIPESEILNNPFIN